MDRDICVNSLLTDAGKLLFRETQVLRKDVFDRHAELSKLHNILPHELSRCPNLPEYKGEMLKAILPTSKPRCSVAERRECWDDFIGIVSKRKELLRGVAYSRHFKWRIRCELL